jgi:hypothetical protein
MQINHFQRFAPVIQSLTAAELAGAPGLYDKLRIATDGKIDVFYAPFEYVNPLARIVIVGITPGRTQMLNALGEFRRQLNGGANEQTVLRAAKSTGSFSGAMRPNLVSLLDSVGLNRLLGLSSCEELFGRSAHLVQTTSALRNPVFVGGENYNGAPSMTRHGLLRQQLIDGFGLDAKSLPAAVFLPLGEKVAEALGFLADRGYLRDEQILRGLPHPSGANAERIAYFLGKKARADLSVKTDPEKIDQARAGLLAQIASLV